jgi:hypothetical protein
VQVTEDPVIAARDRELSNDPRDSQLEIGKTGAAVRPLAPDVGDTVVSGKAI